MSKPPNYHPSKSSVTYCHHSMLREIGFVCPICIYKPISGFKKPAPEPTTTPTHPAIQSYFFYPVTTPGAGDRQSLGNNI
jgi:hypothetical protein